MTGGHERRVVAETALAAPAVGERPLAALLDELLALAAAGIERLREAQQAAVGAAA